jgi:hypothetical protein
MKLECGAEQLAHPDIGRATIRLLDNLGCFVTLPDGQRFTFASEIESEVKVIGDPVCEDDAARNDMAGVFADHGCVRAADGIGYIPEGVRPLVVTLADKAKKPDGTTKPLVHMHRRPGGARHDYEFGLPDDPVHTAEQAKEILASLGIICLAEDISTIGSSAYAVAKMMRTVNPHLRIHTLAMLHRGNVKPEYQIGKRAVGYHALAKLDIPFTKAAFATQLPWLKLREITA